MWSILSCQSVPTLILTSYGLDSIRSSRRGGVNYIRIHRVGLMSYDIFSARPKLGLSKGSMDANKDTAITKIEGGIEEVKQRFMEALPELERSVGLRFWSTIPMWDDNPPALYIGLYKPTEAQLTAIAKAMKNSMESRGIILRFYEALSSKNLSREIEEAGATLAKSIRSRDWDSEIPIPIVNGPGAVGALEVVVNYTKTGRTYPDQEYVARVIKAVRDKVSHRIPVIFTFPIEIRAGLDVLDPSISYLRSWTSSLPVLIAVVSLLTVSFVTIRRTRKGPKV